MDAFLKKGLFGLPALVSYRALNAFFICYDCPTWTSYKTLIWENQPHQATQMHVHKLSLHPLSFHLFVYFRDGLHLFLARPLFPVCEQRLQGGTGMKILSDRECWKARELLSGIYPLQQMFLVANKGHREPSHSVSVSVSLSHLWSDWLIIICWRELVWEEDKRNATPLAIYNPLLWITKTKKKSQPNNLISHSSTATLDHWFSVFFLYEDLFIKENQSWTHTPRPPTPNAHMVLLLVCVI